MPNQYRTTQFALCKANQDMPRSMNSATDDWFGCQYIFSEKYGTPTPHGIMFEDITEWESTVKWPNMDDYVWEKSPNFKQKRTKYSARLTEMVSLSECICSWALKMPWFPLLQNRMHVKHSLTAWPTIKLKSSIAWLISMILIFVIYNDDWGTAKDFLLR